MSIRKLSSAFPVLLLLFLLGGCGPGTGTTWDEDRTGIVVEKVDPAIDDGEEVSANEADFSDQEEKADSDVDSDSVTDSEMTTAGGSYTSPKKGDTFAYLINSGKAGNQTPSAKVYFIDLFDTSSSKISSLKSKGKTVICYFSAGTYENWRSDKGKFSKSAIGKSLDGWAGEKWINYKDSGIRDIMSSRIRTAKSKGCHGVDPDNIDGHANNTGFSLSSGDQKKYIQFLADTAHSNGLSIGLKNSAETAKSLVNYTDFAVIEECFNYGECGSYSTFKSKGKAQFMIEYRSKSSSQCSKAKNYGADLIFADMDLTKFSYCQ